METTWLEGVSLALLLDLVLPQTLLVGALVGAETNRLLLATVAEILATGTEEAMTNAVVVLSPRNARKLATSPSSHCLMSLGSTRG